MPDGNYGGNAAGFVVSNDEISFYYAGDTALTLEMQLVAMTCPTLDFAILPIGDNFTMGYKDAITAADFIQCQTIVGCHFDTFDVIKIDSEDAQKVFTDAGLELHFSFFHFFIFHFFIFSFFIFSFFHFLTL
jgi:L-ascorbate metabolism protein UlaG (beta-lactamase superfamily)